MIIDELLLKEGDLRNIAGELMHSRPDIAEMIITGLKDLEVEIVRSWYNAPSANIALIAQLKTLAIKALIDNSNQIIDR